MTVTDINEPATGVPTITGGKREGDRITADITGITDQDDDSLDNWKYQWLRGTGTTFTEITGATSATYTLKAADADKHMRVHVTYRENASGTARQSDPIQSESFGPVVENHNPTIGFTDRTIDENSTRSPSFTVSFNDQNTEDVVKSATVAGADGGDFTIDTDGNLNFKTTPDYETDAPASGNKIHNVTISVTTGVSPYNRTTNRDFRIEVKDVAEPPLAPSNPSLSNVKQRRVRLSWTAPDNTGRPPITKYQVQYRDHATDAWADDATDTTLDGTTAANYNFTGLNRNNHYDFRVRAVNDEGTGPWSTHADKSTLANQPPELDDLANQPPELDDDYSGSIVENTSAGHTIQTITATDADIDDEGTWTFTKSGTDHAKFTLENTGGIAYIKVKDPLNFEDFPTDGNTLTLQLTDTADVTITVTDRDEPPGKPNAPTVVAGTNARTLDVTWTAPANTGPDITGYTLQHKIGTAADSTYTGQTLTGTTLSKTITGLRAGIEYHARVRATNDEGTSPWSSVGKGNTADNVGPTFGTTTATYSVAEDIGDAAGSARTLGTLTATDADNGAISYSLTGGDSSLFEIGASTGAVKSKAQRFDHEAKATYAFNVVATDSHPSETGKTAQVAVTVSVTDQDEPPPGPHRRNHR